MHAPIFIIIFLFFLFALFIDSKRQRKKIVARRIIYILVFFVVIAVFAFSLLSLNKTSSLPSTYTGIPTPKSCEQSFYCDGVSADGRCVGLWRGVCANNSY